MLMPAKTKFRKQQKGRNRRTDHCANKVDFGSVGLQAVGRGFLSMHQLEAARRVITRTMKRGGKIWIRVFPDKPITKRPAETRMGKGKGAVDTWVVTIRPGRILYEVEGVDIEMAEKALKLAGAKLPVKTKIVRRGLI